MDSGIPDRSQWKFDPQTGQRISDNAPTAGQPTQPVQAYSPTPPTSQSQSQADSFRVQPNDTPPSYSQQPEYTTPQAAQQGSTRPYPQSQPYQPVAAPIAQVNVQEKRRSKAPLVLGLLGLLLLAGLAAGGYYLYQNTLNRPAVSVERLLPANTIGYLSFDPVLEGSQKEAMDKIREAFESQPGFKEAWSKIIEEGSNKLGVDAQSMPEEKSFETISQYLGNNLTIAILPPNSSDLEKLEETVQNDPDAMQSVAGDLLGRNAIGIVDLDFNPLNKKGPITDLKREADNAGKAELVERYREVDIRKFITNTTEVYFSLLDGTSTAIVGAKVEPLRTVIDQYKDGSTLKDDATFKALSGQVPQERIGALYLNLTELYRQVAIAAPEALQSAGNLRNADGAMLLTVSGQNDGIQIDVASEADLSVMGTGIQMNPNAKPDVSTLTDVRTPTFGFFMGTDLQSTIKTTLDALQKDPDMGGDFEDGIRDFEEQAGVSLEDDILPILTGDYLISVTPDDRNGSVNPVMVVQIKVKDPAKASDTLQKLVDNVSGGSQETLEIAGGTFYAPEPGTGVLLGVAQNRLWVVYDSDVDEAQASVEEAIGSIGKGLGTTTEWRETAKHLPRDANAIGYMDLKTLRETIEKSMEGTDREDYDATAAPLLRPFKYMLMGSATQAAREGTLSRNHSVFFIGISK